MTTEMYFDPFTGPSNDQSYMNSLSFFVNAQISFKPIKTQNMSDMPSTKKSEIKSESSAIKCQTQSKTYFLLFFFNDVRVNLFQFFIKIKTTRFRWQIWKFTAK